MPRDEFDKTKHLITQAICEHMPSAAIASGWISPVDPAAFIAAVSERFPYGSRPDDMGLTALTGWLMERGVEAGVSFIKALQLEWIKEEMRRYCEANGPIRI